MKKSLTVGLVLAALAATLTFVAASSIKREPVTEADALPAYEILITLRQMGLNPINEPVRRGPYYVLHANDPRGVEVRVVADAQFGDILSVAPAQALNAAYAPRYDRAPRIIHVPQPGARDDRASVNQRGEPALPTRMTRRSLRPRAPAPRRGRASSLRRRRNGAAMRRPNRAASCSAIRRRRRRVRAAPY